MNKKFHCLVFGLVMNILSEFLFACIQTEGCIASFKINDNLRTKKMLIMLACFMDLRFGLEQVLLILKLIIIKEVNRICVCRIFSCIIIFLGRFTFWCRNGRRSM